MKFFATNYHVMKSIKRAVWSLGEHAFSAILFFVLIDILAGALIIYIYIVLPQGEKFPIDEDLFRFKEDIYQKVLIQQEKNQQYINTIPQNGEESIQENGS